MLVNHPARTPARRLRHLALAAALAPALALTGCSGADKPAKSAAKPSASASTPEVPTPDGVTVTKPGSTLQFGQPGTVAYAANEQKKSVLQLTVDSVRQGRMSDFRSYQLDARTSASTPYYVSATVKNLGDGDLGGIPVPLFATNADNTLVQASSFTNDFAPCASKPLPPTFAKDATAKTCLVYLLPDHGTLKSVSYRPLQAVEAITWTGQVTPAGKSGKAGKKPGTKKPGTKKR